AQVMTAGHLIGKDDAKTVPVLLLMLGIGVLIGIVNGLATTVLRVPSFIVTLGTMLVIHGGIMRWTGGSATGDPAESFRSSGRGGIDGVPVLERIPCAVLILLGGVLIGGWSARRPCGRTLVAMRESPAARAVA